jgi:hypothetical protein
VINRIRQLREGDMLMYDKLVRPTKAQPGPDTPEDIRVGVYVDRIWDVDPVAETFMIEGYLRLSWNDPRLAFNVTEAGRHRFNPSTWLPAWWNGRSSELPTIIIDYMTDLDVVEMIWDPVLFIGNSVNPKGLEKTAGAVYLSADGTVYRSVRFVDTICTRFDFRWFPYDTQKLVANLQIYYYSKDDVLLSWANEPVGTETNHCDVAKGGLPDVSEWVLEDPQFAYAEDFVSTTGMTHYQQLTITIDAARQYYMWQRSYIWPSTFIVMLSFMGLLLEPTTEMRSGMHVIALLTQVTLLSSLMSSMPSIGYHTWMVGWAVDMMLLTAFMLMECIIAAYGKHSIQAARDAITKKDGDALSTHESTTVELLQTSDRLNPASWLYLLSRVWCGVIAVAGRTTTDARELKLSTLVLVLGELDTIARMVFPCVFVSNTLLKELRLLQDPRVGARWAIVPVHPRPCVSLGSPSYLLIPFVCKIAVVLQIILWCLRVHCGFVLFLRRLERGDIRFCLRCRVLLPWCVDVLCTADYQQHFTAPPVKFQ